MRRLARVVLGILPLLTAALPAQAEPDFAKARNLVDQHSRPLASLDFGSRIRLVAFGYTRCPDICPTTLATITSALDALPPQIAGRIVPVFVAADPVRDTPAILNTYLESFHPRFVGVTGPVAAIDDLAWSFKALVIRHPDEGGGTYAVDHATDLYLIGPGGAVIARLPHTIAPDALAERLRATVSAFGF